MRLQKLSFFIMISIVFSGCFLFKKKIYPTDFIRDNGHFMDDDVVKRLSLVSKLLRDKTGVHLFLITQTQNTPNPSGGNDFMKHYKQEHDNLPGIIFIVWHHDHSRLDIVVSPSLKITSSIQSVSKDFYKMVNILGFNVSFTKVVMALSSVIASQFKVDFKKLIKEKYPHYDNLDVPLKKLKNRKKISQL